MTQYSVMLGNETRYATAETYQAVVEAMMAAHPGLGVPQIVQISQVHQDATAVEAPAPAPAPKPIAVGAYDAVGDARAAVDRATAEDNGFSPKRPIYRQGSRAVGSERHREEFDALPAAAPALLGLADQVEGEQREFVTALPHVVRMASSGRLIRYNGAEPLAVAQRALPAIAARMGMPAGSGEFLSNAPTPLRAATINRFARDHADGQAKPFYIRTRLGEGAIREAFAAVSKRYTAVDVDVVARALADVVRGEAKADITYDGFRLRARVLYFTDVKPTETVAGEFFRAGVEVTTDDTGAGGLRVSALVWQNLCLNFIIVDAARVREQSIRHIGDPQELRDRLKTNVESAAGRIDSFLDRWGYAARESVAPAGVPVSVALPGLFNAMIERELVPLPKRKSARPQILQDLSAMYAKDASFAAADGRITRAGLANAITRYAHEVNTDPWAESALEQAAGRLIWSTKPLPYSEVRA